MPKEIEDKLKKEAAKKGFKKDSDRYNAYVWGTLRKLGWKPSTQKGD
jgi:hypothetical protein